MPDIKMEGSSFKVYYDKLYHQYQEVKFPLFQLPFQKNKLFTGREEQLKQISEYLTTQNTLVITSSVLSQAQTVVGLGGVGKTQLVIEYAFQAKNTYQIIWFLNGHNLDADYLMLAAQLKVYGDSKEEVVECIKNKLQKMGNYLLVIDDAEDYESVKDYLPKTGNNGHVLITTRYKNHWQQLLELGVFDLDEALAYFKQLINYAETDREKVIYLVDTLLGRLPLALTQAGAFIKHTGITVEKYIGYFEIQIKALWGEEKKPEDYSCTIAVTWNITLDKIKETHPRAEDLLCGMSFLAPGPYVIEQNWFSGVIENELDRREGLGVLVIYSMLDVHTNGYIVHQLVQEVIFANLSAENMRSYFGQVYKILETIYPYKPQKEESKDYLLQYRLLPHLEALLKRFEAFLIQINLNDLEAIKAQELEQAYVLNLLAYGYGNPHLSNNFRKQATFWERELTILKKYCGDDDPQIAQTLMNLGNAYGSLGDTRKKKELLECALIIKEKCYEPDHLEIAITLKNLGDAYGALGYAQQQKILLERALTILEKHYGLAHSALVNTLTSLGNAYGDLGDAQKKKSLLERALAILEKKHGLEYPEIAVVLTNLGPVYGTLGDIQKEKTLLERALTIHEKHYECKHPIIAKTLVNLSTAYSVLGDFQKQKSLLERALPIEEQYYGLDHPDVAMTLTNLANTYGSLGDAQQQKILLQRALPILEKHYKNKHPNLAITLRSLGKVYDVLDDDAQQQLTLLQRALLIFEQHYGSNHPQVAITLGSLAVAYFELKQLNEAKATAERAYQIFLVHPDYGPQHLQTQSVRNNLLKLEGELRDKKETASHESLSPSFFQLPPTLMFAKKYFLPDNEKKRVSDKLNILNGFLKDFVPVNSGQEILFIKYFLHEDPFAADGVMCCQESGLLKTIQAQLNEWNIPNTLYSEKTNYYLVVPDINEDTGRLIGALAEKIKQRELVKPVL